jgi:hypothetical protein
MIPRPHQALASTLHAAYTPAAIAQVRDALTRGLTPESQTTWWLAACWVCTEGDATVESFTSQLAQFALLTASSATLIAAANAAYADMRTSFELVDGVPRALVDGGMQGAYIAGYDLATAYDPTHDLYFIGTFHDNLGLESFPWCQPPVPNSADPQDRLGRSGPVHGSRQFVKCTDAAELASALAAVTINTKNQ